VTPSTEAVPLPQTREGTERRGIGRRGRKGKGRVSEEKGGRNEREIDSLLTKSRYITEIAVR